MSCDVETKNRRANRYCDASGDDYLARDGRNPMVGALDMGGNDILDAKDTFVDTLTIDGVLVSVTAFSGNNIAKTYLTVAAMIAASDLAVGDTAITQGYTTAGDGRGAVYRIVAAATGTEDGVLYHDLTGITGQAEFVSGGERHRYITSDPATSFHVLDPEYNEWDEAGNLNVLLAAATNGSQINYLGVDDAVPQRYTSNGGAGDPTNIAIGWGPDSGYTGPVGISSIVGGYDNVVNAGASSIIGSYHSMIAEGPELHNTIVGGTTCFVSGTNFGAPANTGRAGFFNSYNCSVKGGPYNSLIGSSDSYITASYSMMIGSQGSTIGRGSENVIVGSEDCLIDNTGEVSPGRNNGIYSSGDVNMEVGSWSVAIGLSGGDIGPNVHASGKNAESIGGGRLYAVDQMARQGDAQSHKYLLRIRTTDAGNESLDAIGIGSGSEFATELPVASAFTGHVKLIGMMDGSALGNNDGVYKTISFEDDFGGMYDGTNVHLYKSGTETALSAADVELSLTEMVQANNTIVLTGADPRLRLNSGSGQLYVRLNGLAATVINWVAEIEIVMTRCGA